LTLTESLSSKTGSLEKWKNPAVQTLIAYLLSSALLSVVISLRLLVTTSIIVKVFNIFMYLTTYFAVPLSALGWLYRESVRRKSRLSWAFWALLTLLLSYLIAVLFFPPIASVISQPEYLVMWVPIVLMILLYARWYRHQGFFNRKTAAIFALLLSVSILLPNITVFACVTSYSNQARSITSESDRAGSVSGYVIGTTAFNWRPRAFNDPWKFMLIGAGACGEMAIAANNFLRALGSESRKVGFPGEDHAFVEVEINGSWFIVDPGYYGPKVISRSERAADRIRSVGTVSYVAAYAESSFIELTQYYVSTDTITIRITEDGESLAGASVVLVHTLRYDSNAYDTQLPGQGYVFHTDTNGKVTLHLGKLAYVAPFEKTDPYYWIYVNGQNTGQNVTSTGTGQTHLVEIDLTGKNPEIDSSIVR